MSGSALVRAEALPRTPRIGPKVFADVPTSAELAAVRRSRNGLAMWVLMLLAVLVALVVAGVVFVGPGYVANQTNVSTLTLSNQAIDNAIVDLNSLSSALNRKDSAPLPVLARWSTAPLTDKPKIHDAIVAYTTAVQRARAAQDQSDAALSLYKTLSDNDSGLQSEVDQTALVIKDRGNALEEAVAKKRQDDPLALAFQTYKTEKETGSWIGAEARDLQQRREKLHSACQQLENWVPAGKSRAELEKCVGSTP
jgi:hypothetical protein